MVDSVNPYAGLAGASNSDGVAGSTNPTKSDVAANKANMNFDMFLKLLVTQIQNQDPLKPMDGTQFTEQIASFSGLEQQIQTNSLLEKMADQRAMSQQGIAVGMLGKEVLAAGENINLVDGKSAFTYALEENSVATVLEVYDSGGAKVRTLEGETKKGMHIMEWDGKNDAGEAVEDGRYFTKISAINSEGKKIGADTLVFNKVVGVESQGFDTTYLVLENGESVLFDEVFSVREPTQVVAQSPDAGDESNDDEQA